MKKATLYILLFWAAPFYLLAQYGGGNGNGEVLKPATTLQLDGNVISLFGGGNGSGESDSMMYTNQLNGILVGIYSGGNGRGESDSMHYTNQLDGANLGIYSGGNGRGETDFTQNTLQLDGLVASIYLGGNGRGETMVQVSGTALPIKLLSFAANLLGKEVKVQWQTSSEINSAFFVVEKSTTGTGNWQAIGKVSAAGNSDRLLNYQFFDANLTEGLNYYRLKPTDLDGKFTYSAIAVVDSHTAIAHQIIVYPNPVKYQFTLQINGGQTVVKLNIRLVNSAGQTVLQKQNLSGNTQIVDVSMLAAGIYYLMVDNNGEASVVKVVKE